MNKRFRRRIAGSALVLASLGMASTALALGGSPAGATTSHSTATTCSDPLCALYETIVFDVTALLNSL
ncbi:MAG TPA: hypothetical protein VGG38_02530 [Acidimicrobiales bacterium]|jgi:hypothetical protein